MKRYLWILIGAHAICLLAVHAAWREMNMVKRDSWKPVIWFSYGPQVFPDVQPLVFENKKGKEVPVNVADYRNGRHVYYADESIRYITATEDKILPIKELLSNLPARQLYVLKDRVIVNTPQRTWLVDVKTGKVHRFSRDLHGTYPISDTQAYFLHKEGRIYLADIDAALANDLPPSISETDFVDSNWEIDRDTKRLYVAGDGFWQVFDGRTWKSTGVSMGADLDFVNRCAWEHSYGLFSGGSKAWELDGREIFLEPRKSYLGGYMDGTPLPYEPVMKLLKTAQAKEHPVSAKSTRH